MLVACHLEGLTHEEAASRLHWPLGTVRSRLARGRDRLRDRLARRGLAPSVVLPALPRPTLPAGLRESTARTLLSFTNGPANARAVSASVAALTQGVIRAMLWTKIRTVAAVVLTIGLCAVMLPLTLAPILRDAGAADAKNPDDKNARSTIAGVVKDAKGQPVEGATVVAGAFNEQSNHQIARTGPDGRFAFTSEDEKNKLEYALAYKEGLAPASKLRQGPGEVELTLKTPAPFVGIVQDRDGQPIAGAEVQIRSMKGNAGPYDLNPVLMNVLRDTPLEPLVRATTDAQGRFRFPAVPPPYRVELLISSAGKADRDTMVPGDFEAGYITGTADAPARLTLDPEAVVQGRIVTDLPGVSVAGIKVGLQSTNDSTAFWRSVETDADGRFTMRGLPEGGANIFPIDHPNDGPWTYRAIDNLALHPGKTAEVTIALIEGVQVEGDVVLADGKPMTTGFVGVHGPARPGSGAAILGAHTDAQGHYRFRLPPGETYVYLAGGAPWPLPSHKVEIPDDAKTFTVPTLVATAKKAARPAARAEPTKSDREQTTLTGSVRDVEDRPIAGATVIAALIEDDRMPARQVVTTGTDGRFTLDLAGAKTSETLASLIAYKDGLAPAAREIRLSETPRPDVSLILPRPRPFVGIVEDEDEHPIPGAEVRVQSIKSPLPEGSGLMVTLVREPVIRGTPLEAVFVTTTDEQGRFRFPSMPARSVLNLVATARGKTPHRTSDFTRPGMIGRWPSGFDDGYLHGSPDVPAILYLGTEALPFP